MQQDNNTKQKVNELIKMLSMQQEIFIIQNGINKQTLELVIRQNNEVRRIFYIYGWLIGMIIGLNIYLLVSVWW